MPQIIPTTNDLIIDSLQLIGELGVGELADAFMLSKGLTLINEIIAKFTSDSIYVPFLTTINSVFVPGQQTYSLSDMISSDIVSDRIIDLSFANYVVQPESDQPITYPLKIISKAEYYNIITLQNLRTRPCFIFLNKQSLESFITVYPAPDQPYPFFIQCKVMLDSLDSDQSIIELPPYYYGFLKYALARKFIDYYPSGNWKQTSEDEYLSYINNLKNANETDLTIRPSVLLTAPGSPFWQMILSYY
ncbi:MAG TPA: hypothetical protein VNF93_02320 [Buchnera sp. (in: enterobacteria)]|nr:hypothetical protein [Buchnera sp. (in: enterobacteria)]